jgi:hypothetical protein
MNYSLTYLFGWNACFSSGNIRQSGNIRSRVGCAARKKIAATVNPPEPRPSIFGDEDDGHAGVLNRFPRQSR